MSPTLRRDLITILVLWVVLSAFGELASGYAIAHYPGAASDEGIVTSDAFFFLLRVSVPVLILVALIVIYSAIHFRVADDDSAPSPKQYRGARAFPWGWVVVSTILNVLFIFHPGITGLDALWAMAAAANDPIKVDVTAKQWEWSFDYPDQKLSAVGELVVPVNTPIRFVIRSEDVIHSFWVPDWGLKKAAIPGETRTLTVTPHQITNTEDNPLMRVQCSQICGAGHAEMRAVVRVVSRDDFATWVDETRKAAESEMGGMGGMNMNMGEPGQMNMPEGGSMDMPNGGDTNMQNGGGTNMQDGGGMNMQDGDSMNMNGQSGSPAGSDSGGMPMPMGTSPEGAADGDQMNMKKSNP